MRNINRCARVLRGMVAAMLLVALTAGMFGCSRSSSRECEPPEDPPRTRGIPDPMTLE